VRLVASLPKICEDCGPGDVCDDGSKVTDERKWLPLREAIARTGLSDDTIRRRADEGVIESRWTRPNEPVGRRGQRQYLESSVDAYVRSMESGEGGQPPSD